jgi:hypothetical protein
LGLLVVENIIFLYNTNTATTAAANTIITTITTVNVRSRWRRFGERALSWKGRGVRGGGGTSKRGESGREETKTPPLRCKTKR